MKKSLAFLLITAMLALFVCGCSSQGEQATEKEQKNKTQSVTTAAETTQPATEPDYTDTNFIAQPPQGKLNYTIEKISLDEAAEAVGFSASDSKFRCTYAYVKGDYIVVKIAYSNINSPDCCNYNVIYDLDGNVVANISSISTELGYKKSGFINGIYGDYVVLELSPISSSFDDVYYLYNLKTKEMKNIDYHSARLDNGVIIVGTEDPERENGFKNGALDLDLNVIIPVEYESLSLASPELFRARKDEKYGLIDFNNNNVTDFKFKNIYDFIGVFETGKINTISLLDFEKNINKYAVATTETDEQVLIDKEGNVITPEFDVSDDEYRRTISQYNGNTFVMKSDNQTITDLDGNEIIGNSSSYGYINGYCVTMDKDGTCGLVDSNGKIVYSESPDSEYYGVSISPVDQNGLFVVSNGHNTRIMDLNKNEVYLTENNRDIFSPVGKGIFTKTEDKGYSIHKVKAI